jgi:hypothetical protein
MAVAVCAAHITRSTTDITECTEIVTVQSWRSR